MEHLPELVNMIQVSIGKNKENRTQNIFFQARLELSTHSNKCTVYIDFKSDRKKWINYSKFLWDFSGAITFLNETLPPFIKNSNLIYLHTNLFLCSSCRVHPALLLKLHLLSVSFRLIMPWHSAKIVSLKDVTRALTQHSMSWNTLNAGLAQAAIWMLKSDVSQVCHDTKANLSSTISSIK